MVNNDNQDAGSLKVIKILEALSEVPDGMGVTEICRVLGFSKGTVHRILTELVLSGYVLKNEDSRRYRLSLRILRLSNQILESLELRRLARQEMQTLADLTKETIHLVWLELYDGIYIDKIETPHSIGLLSKIGVRIYLHCTAAGKAVLAFLDDEERKRILWHVGLPKRTPATITTPENLAVEINRIRHNCFALDNEENKEGVVCIGAPILQANGKPVAAISVSGPSFRFNAGHALSFGPMVREAAIRISRKLGYGGVFGIEANDADNQ